MNVVHRFLVGGEKSVLATLVVSQWVVVAIYAATVERNGWLFYQGGDQTWFYTSGWVLAHGHIPETFVGWVWAVVMAPIAAIAGPSFLSGVPAVVVLQFVFLLPLGLLCVYAIAARIGGRPLGYWAAAWWIVLPFAIVPLFVERYRETWGEQVLAQVFGLTGLADYPSMVVLLVAALLVFRALENDSAVEVVAAGLVTGLAIGVKPSNGLFVFAPLVAFALARRWRRGFEFGLALLPSLVVLALWKDRGSGITLLAAETVRLAADSGTPDFSPPTFWERVRAYVPFDHDQLNQQFLGFREFFWSARLLEFVPLAGLVAVFRRSVPFAGFLAVWLAAFFVIKGSTEAVNVESGSLWRFLMPAWPAYFLLGVSIPLLVPTFGTRLLAGVRAAQAPRLAPRYLIVLAVVVFAPPALAFAAIPSDDSRRSAKLEHRSLFIPIDRDFLPEGHQGADGRLRITWPAAAGYANAFYVVFRSPRRYVQLASGMRVEKGQLCREEGGGALRCALWMEEIGRTRLRLWRELPPRGEWTYRIGIAANWEDDPDQGDVLVVSPPLDVTVR